MQGCQQQIWTAVPAKVLQPMRPVELQMNLVVVSPHRRAGEIAHKEWEWSICQHHVPETWLQPGVGEKYQPEWRRPTKGNFAHWRSPAQIKVQKFVEKCQSFKIQDKHSNMLRDAQDDSDRYHTSIDILFATTPLMFPCMSETQARCLDNLVTLPVVGENKHPKWLTRMKAKNGIGNETRYFMSFCSGVSNESKYPDGSAAHHM